MSSLFCPKCGSLLLPKKDDTKTLVCSCGYKTNNAGPITIKDQPSEKNKKVEIIDHEFEVAPLTEAECPKCHHKKAYYWLVQTRAADEAETKFLKCEKCKYTWRDYS